MTLDTATVDARAILRPFGHVPSSDPKHVFESPLIYAAADIRALYPDCDYDHKPESPAYDNRFPFIHTEQFRRGYAAFKYSVAKVLQPRTICEIGIGSGVAARAFLAASPSARYTGIDDGSKNLEENCGVTDHTRRLLIERGYQHEIIISDSLKLASVPKADLFHVDGAHDFDHAMNDTKLAFASGSEWILVDDTRDPTVASAAMMAAFGARVMFQWAYFEDTWTGSILFNRVE